MKTNIFKLLQEFYLNQEFEKTKDCPDEVTLYKYVFSYLDKENYEQVKHHILKCDYCFKKILEIKQAEEIDKIEEDVSLTEKIYNILKDLSDKFMILEIKQQRNKFYLQAIKESQIFKPIIESFKIPADMYPSYGLGFLITEEDKILRKTKIGDVDLQLSIKCLTQEEIQFIFLFKKDNISQKNVLVKIDDKEFLSSKEGKVETILPIKDKYKVQILHRDSKLEFDIFLTR